MNIAIVQTHQQNAAVNPVATPIGIASLAAYLREHSAFSHDIRLIDMALDHLTVDQVVERVGRFHPDLIGLGVRTVEAATMHALARKLKKTLPEVPIVAGGPHPTAIPQAVLSDRAIDCAVIGEGEVTFTELVDRVARGQTWKGLAGCAWRDEDTVRLGPPRPLVEDLDSLPFPAWDLLDLRAYSDPKRAPAGLPRFGRYYSTLMTTRGCPYRCIYCHNIFGKRLRTKSPDRVLEEILWMNDTFGIDDFHIWDDCFNLHKDRAIRIFKAIKESGRDLHFSFPNALRMDLIDPALITALEEGGTYLTCVAIETATPRLQKLIRKHLNLDKARKSIDLLARSRILTHGYFMLGFPSETLAEMEATVRFAIDSKLDSAFFFRVLPLPGTELHRMVRGQQDDARVDWDAFRFADIAFSETTNCSPVPAEQIGRLQARAMRAMNVSPRRIARIARKVPPAFLLRLARRNASLILAYRARRLGRAVARRMRRAG